MSWTKSIPPVPASGAAGAWKARATKPNVRKRNLRSPRERAVTLVAPLGQRSWSERNTRLRRCQSSDRIEVLHDPVSQHHHLAVIDRLELEFAPGLQRPHRRNRRRQVHPRRGGRPAGRRPRQRRPRADRRGDRHRPGRVREAGRRRSDRPPRDLLAGPQPRLRRRRARHQRGAARGRRHRSSICTASTSTRCCSIRRRTSICSTSSPG